MWFGLSSLIAAYALWYAQRRLADPINSIVEQSRRFDASDPERQLRNSKELEQKNRALAAAVQRADEASAAKADFYSRMSHDMRTPMNGIIGLVELSRDETDPAVLHRNLGEIGSASNYLLCLINDTLDMSKLESNKMVLADAPVRMDELRVKQIFMNLASNAIKFTPEGGMITLRVEETGRSGNVSHICATLRDTGVGMSEVFWEKGSSSPFRRRPTRSRPKARAEQRRRKQT